MSADDSHRLSAEERDDHLGNGGTGVLSLSRSNTEPPRTLPISYGYDATEATFYFRLSGGILSEELDGHPVSFVTYGDGEDGWWSIVATGRLEDVEREGIATETLDGLDRVHIPLVDMFDAPTREVSFDFLRLVPDELTARREASSEI
jgi:nitroimidazol reductase NimA-like FMN-containing flavoprotein (pyridoxamine 5'-phosphate oxidase superfamily)